MHMGVNDVRACMGLHGVELHCVGGTWRSKRGPERYYNKVKIFPDKIPYLFDYIQLNSFMWSKPWRLNKYLKITEKTHTF